MVGKKEEKNVAIVDQLSDREKRLPDWTRAYKSARRTFLLLVCTSAMWSTSAEVSKSFTALLPRYHLSLIRSISDLVDYSELT
jgi:hypothetical protein